mgnify:CR=1 FL=1
MGRTPSAAELLEDVARALVGGGAWGQRGQQAPRRALSLSDIIEASADEDSAPVELYEAASRPLVPRRPPRSGLGLVHLGVDSSSRDLVTPYADVVLSAVSISGPGPVELCDYPSLYSPGCGGSGAPPFAYLVPHGPLDVPELEGLSVVPAPADGVSQGFMYGLMSYARLSLESWALGGGPSLELARAYAEAGRRPIIMLDGPVFIAQGKGVGDLMMSRYEAVRRLEGAGFPVIGVVKRVERSTLLSRAQGFLRLAEACGVRAAQGLLDSMLIERLASACGWDPSSPGRAYATPKVMVRTDGVEKIVEYVILSPSAWHPPGVRSRVYRVEYTPETRSLLEEEYGIDPVQAFLADSVSRQSPSPLSITLSDRRAKSLTASLKGLLAKAVVGLGGRVGYESEVELAEEESEL